MRVILRPNRYLLVLSNLYASLDLQPAEQNMQIGLAPHITIYTIAQFNTSKPAVEEEEIARLHAHILQVAFGYLGLPEERLPTGQAWSVSKAIAIQVGIEMREILAKYLSARQVEDKLAEIMFAIVQISIVCRAAERWWFRYWKRAKFVRWKYRAGDLSGTGIEALADDDEIRTGNEPSRLRPASRLCEHTHNGSGYPTQIR